MKNKTLSWKVLGVLAIFFSIVMEVVGGVIGDAIRILVVLLWIFAFIDLMRVVFSRSGKKQGVENKNV